MHDIPVYPSILALLEAQAMRRGSAVALDSPGASPVTYEQLHRRVVEMAARLRASGVGSGTGRLRVAIVLPNGPELSVALLGVSCAGVAVPLNPAYREDEFRAYFSETGVAFLLTGQGESGPAVGVARDIGLSLLRLGGDGMLIDTPSAASTSPVPEPGDVALILLTSGSTGRAKKVPLTHRNLCTSARDVCRSVALGPNDRCLSMWEQYHIGGLVDLLLAPLASGGSVICAGGFNPDRFYELLGSAGPTWFQGVPTTLRELCLHVRGGGAPLGTSSLRFIRSVAAALPRQWMEDIEARFGVPVIQTFGMTEASPLITSNLLPPGQRKPGSAGKPCGPAVAIMDDHGKSLANGQHGQIATRGENIFAGYEGDSQANADSFRNGWFYTGDTGYFDDDGYLFLTGRVKEMINRGGEKISPVEIDQILLQHPAIEQAAAFGLTHPTLGEEVGVAIVLKRGFVLLEADVRAYAAERLAAFKVPKRVLFLPELPRCPVGKIRRQELAERSLRQASQVRHVPPRNDLEAFLARLWAAELNVGSVGVEDDFSMLGGDSLSRVRLIVAMQSLLGIRIPDDAESRFSSVRSLAEYLVENGCVTEDPGRPDRLPGGAKLTDLDVHTALSRAGTANPALLADVDAVRNRVDACRSRVEFDTLQQLLVNYMTPAELARLLVRDPATTGLSGVLRILRSPRGWRLDRERARWRRELSGELAQAGSSLKWSRHVVAENMWLYTAEDIPCCRKTLLVGFASITMRLMMPDYRVLNQLDPDRFDVLMLRDPERKHYESGIAGVCGNLESLAERLEDFRRSGQYKDASTIGVSAGGLAAIYVALHNRWGRAVTVGADRLSSHPITERLLDSLCQDSDRLSTTRVIVAYSGQNKRDSDGADEIVCKLSTVTRLPDHRFKTHNLLKRLHSAGELKGFFTAHLG